MVDVRCARCCEGEEGAKAVVWEKMVVRKMEVAVMNFMVVLVCFCCCWIRYGVDVSELARKIFKEIMIEVRGNIFQKMFQP